MQHYTYLNLANLYFKQGDFAKAVEYSSRSIRHTPNFVFPHLTMGEAYYRLKNSEKARAAFIQALKIDPSNKEAISWIDRIDKEMPKSPLKEKSAPKI